MNDRGSSNKAALALLRCDGEIGQSTQGMKMSFIAFLENKFPSSAARGLRIECIGNSPAEGHIKMQYCSIVNSTANLTYSQEHAL